MDHPTTIAIQWRLWSESAAFYDLVYCATSPHLVSDPTGSEIELLRAYRAFNARDIDGALALMTSDVAWPRAFKGGFVRGHEEVRAYWREQWSEIDPHVEPRAFHFEGTGHMSSSKYIKWCATWLE